MLYGFESYASFPVVLADGSFYGTLCAIDPQPRALSAPETIALLQGFAARVAEILSERVADAATARSTTSPIG
jgi:GAF domain-containing protein